MAYLVKAAIQESADPLHAEQLRNARADIFLGVRVPIQRKIAKKHRNLPLKDAKELLQSEIHEHRQTSLYILVDQFKKADQQKKKEIIDLYLNNISFINNWDLVDSSADKILGTWLLDKPRDILYRLANSDNLWEKRISIISTFAFIKNDDLTDAIALAKILLHDEQTPIHKATGWVLRVVGKKNTDILTSFLDEHYKEMPRIMPRYATDKLPEHLQKHYLSQNQTRA